MGPSIPCISVPWNEPREGEETRRGPETDGCEVPWFEYDTNSPEYDRLEPILLPWLGEHTRRRWLRSMKKV